LPEDIVHRVQELRRTYHRRSEILGIANQWRNRIGQAFAYQSPTLEARLT